jgi:hypothetical protein
MNYLAKRNIFISVSLVIVLIVILLVRSNTPFGRNQTSFAVSTSSEITKIELSEGTTRLVLTRDKEKWMVNGKYEVRKSGLSYITGILTGMKIKSPVSPDLFEKEITAKGIEPVKARISEGSRLIKEFYVYKTPSNKYGNIMKMRLKSKPFIVYLPGFEGDIGSSFILNELYWKPFTLFNLLPSEISEITFENLPDPTSSFKISASGGRFNLSDMNNDLNGWDTSRVRRYISYFVYIPFENWAFDMPETERKEIESTPPHYILGVIKKDGSTINLKLWDRREEGTGSADTDRLWGKTTDNDNFFVVRYFDIDPVIKKQAYFFGQ